MERHYENDRPQCERKSLVLRRTGALEFHVCELVARHHSECERCPTGALATWDLWDKYRKYSGVSPSIRINVAVLPRLRPQGHTHADLADTLCQSSIHSDSLAQIKVGEVEQIDLKRSVELLQIPFLCIPKSRPYTECHEPEWRKQENHDPFADGSLPIFGSRLGSAVTHGAGLTEARRDPQQKRNDENSDA
jgi:hypothetical protein